MSADLLRRAAAKLRRLAEDATPGPWFAGGDAGGTFEPWEVVIDRKQPLIELESSDRGIATADLIALMHPPVALALADWLEFTAESGLPERRAAAVARAVLREGS